MIQRFIYKFFVDNKIKSVKSNKIFRCSIKIFLINPIFMSTDKFYKEDDGTTLYI